MGRIEADVALELAVRISALFGTGVVYPTQISILVSGHMQSGTNIAV